ncbi:MAG: pilus assembly protein PilN [Desulfobacteraceae bacterium]|nr:MAG: pilus assembly protein PilN [Desulfobacteraceae bacterium]
MIRINLLPFRAARKSENIRRQVSLFLLSLVFVVLVMGYLQISLISKISVLDEKISNTSLELSKYKKQAQEVDQIKKTLDNLEKRTDVMKRLDTNRRGPVKLLESISELIVPNRMWLSNMTVTDTSVKLTGTALDNKTTADFMKRLESSEFFTKVQLHAITHKMSQKQRVKSFTITCIRAQPSQSTKGKVKKNG